MLSATGFGFSLEQKKSLPKPQAVFAVKNIFPELFIDVNMYAVIVLRLISCAVKKVLIPYSATPFLCGRPEPGSSCVTKVRDVCTPKRPAEKETAVCPTSICFWRSDVRTRYAGQLRRNGKVTSLNTDSIT